MKLLTFKGGVHPPYNKEYTKDKSLQIAEEPSIVYIPLQQHIGAPAKAIVQVGDLVKVGQKIGEQQGYISCNVHSSVSGRVKAIKEHEVPGGRSLCVIIENDFKEELHESVKPKGNLEDLSNNQYNKRSRYSWYGWSNISKSRQTITTIRYKNRYSYIKRSRV